MNKETLIALIEKDIDELKTLTRGFSELDEFPQPLLDLAASKADSLRNNLLQLPHISVDKPTENEPIAEKNVPEIEPEIVPEFASESAPIIDAPTPEPEPQPVAEPEPQPVAEPESAETIEPQPEPEATEEPAPAAEPHPTVADTLAKKGTVVDEFEKKDDESLAHAIASQPIADLKQAISIADRFRFQRELFANNGEAMIKALDALNACTTFAEAEQLLINRLKLPTDNPAAADFIELVHRKF